MAQHRGIGPEVSATPHFDFLYGAFRLSSWKIPYLTTTMSIRDAARSLTLAAEMPGVETIRWQVDELFQRDISWGRVENQIVPYLNSLDQPQFFGSLTVALLPFDSSSTKIADSFNGGLEWVPPALEQPRRFQKALPVGPISLGFWENWDTVEDWGVRSGQLRWNTDQIMGVAIDGQHRLAALKHLARTGAGYAALEQTYVPVILLVFSDLLGFSAPEERSHVDLLRILFIDLNKHAKTVNRARQILLDDRDPLAVCVRSIVGNQLDDGLGSLERVDEDVPRLPLSLVDWHTEQAKFDKGPYVSTILGLDWIVGKTLLTKPLGDHTDYGAVRSQLTQFRRRLGLELKDAHERLHDLSTVKLRPFWYEDSELDEIEAAYQEIWAAPICALLTEFAPYRDLITLRRHDESLSLDFQSWYEALKQSEDGDSEGHAQNIYERTAQRISRRPDHPVPIQTLRASLENIDDFKSSSLAFNVVFQRALVLAFLEYAKISPGDVDELLEDYLDDDFDDVDFDDPDELDDDDFEAEQDDSEAYDEGDDELELTEEEIEYAVAILTLKVQHSERSDEFVHALNSYADLCPDFLDLDAIVPNSSSARNADEFFWRGTFRKDDGAIDFTQGASARAMELLFCVAAIKLYIEQLEEVDEDGFDELWSLCLSDDRPKLCHRIWASVRRFEKEKGAAGKILGIDYSEDSARDEARKRLHHIWNILSS